MFNTNEVGSFTIQFEYLDQDYDTAQETLIDMFDIEDLQIEEDADLLWVYILGGLLGGAILLAFCYVCQKYMAVTEKH